MKSPFAAATSAVRPPQRVETLPPSAWAETWADRPREPVKVGLRLVSDKTLENAVHFAEKHADARATHDDVWVEQYNAALRRHALGQILCSPTDASRPYFQGAPDILVGLALRPETMTFLWERFELLKIAASPLTTVGTNEDLIILASLIVDPEQLARTGADELGIRRVAGHLLELMLAAGANAPVEDDLPAEE